MFRWNESIFNESSVPKIMFADEDGGLVRSLKYGKVDILHISGVLAYQCGITFRTVVPQGHSAHGRAEKRIHYAAVSLRGIPTERKSMHKPRMANLGKECHFFDYSIFVTEGVSTV